MPHRSGIRTVLTSVLVLAFAGGLAAEFQVNTYTTHDQVQPAVAPGADGSFVTVWMSRRLGFPTPGGDPWYTLTGRRFGRDGQPLGGEFGVNEIDTAESPAIASDAAGNFVVVWRLGSLATATSIRARRFAADGAPLGASFTVSNVVDYAIPPDVAMDAAGNFVVVWGRRWDTPSSPSKGILGRRYASSGAPVGEAFTVTASTSVAEPKVAITDSGAFLVSWNRGDRYRFLYDARLGRLYDASGDADPEFVVAESSSIGHTADVTVAGSDFVVAWSDSGAVRARRMDENGAMDLPVTLNEHPGSGPSLTRGPDGGLVAAWSAHDGAGAGAFGRRFDAGGAATTDEFRLNAYTTGEQGGPALAAHANGDLLAVWMSGRSADAPGTSARQDGSGTGVFGQSLADELFANGFDSGDLSAWSAASTDGGDLRVVPRLDGEGHSYALQASVDDTAPLFVQDDSPDDEGHYRASFEFDPRGFDPGEANGAHRVRLFLGLEAQPTRRAFALVLRRLGGDYSLRVRVRREDGSRADTPFVPIAAGAHAIELHWVRATRPDSDDGSLSLWIDGALASRLDGLDNPSPGLEAVRLGALSAKAGASGALTFDTFVSRRWSPIGPGAN